MNITEPGNLKTAIDKVFNMDINPAAIAELRSCEDTIVRALEDIVSRAEQLLSLLSDPETAWGAVAEIERSAGCSGPIGSRWEKALAAAAKAKVLGAYATTARDDEEGE